VRGLCKQRGRLRFRPHASRDVPRAIWPDRA
jgi:hypothetical protein